ncbi:MAG: efflux RND transporter periplasmic adaptor subunit [Succinivibrionaceae bacterium]
MRRVILGIFICILVCGGYSWYFLRNQESVKETKNSSTSKVVRVVKVELADTGVVLPLVGKIHARNSVDITPNVAARIDKILVKPIQYVKEGDLLIQLENSKEIAYVKEAKINLDNEIRKLNMSIPLKKKGVISEDAYAQLASNVERLRSVYESKLAELNNRKLIAPFSGYVGLFTLAEGQFVKAGNPLLQLHDLSSVYVDFAISEKYISKIVLGQEIVAKTDAWPEYIFIGKVSHVDTKVNPNSLTVNIRVIFDNQQQKLLDGMMLELSLNLLSKKLPIVPLKAISYVGEERYVYIVGRHNKIIRKKVVLGQVSGGNVAIEQGLKVGNRVVVEGINKIKDGDEVEVIQNESLFELDDNVMPLKKKEKVSKDSLL